MVAENVFLYIGVDDSWADAEADYDVLKELHSGGVVGTYDAAVITKDADGKVHVSKHEKPTQHGACSGLVVGGLIKKVEKQIKADSKAFEKELEQTIESP
jgi:uncharacterized membrane protein